MVSQYGGGFGNNWFDQQWHPTGGWIETTYGEYANIFTGATVDALEFESAQQIAIESELVSLGYVRTLVQFGAVSDGVPTVFASWMWLPGTPEETLNMGGIDWWRLVADVGFVLIDFADMWGSILANIYMILSNLHI